jgi:hypothetical protein
MKLNITLDDELAERFNAVKEHLCVKHDHSVIATLVSKEYDKLKEAESRRIYVSKETYATLEQKANKLGITPDDWVNQVILEKTENLSHARLEKTLRHLFIPAANYELLEKEAKARGQTMDEYVQDLTDKMLRKAKAHPEAFKRGEHRQTED